MHGWACKFEREREREKGMSEAGGGGVGVIMGSVMLQWGKKKKKRSPLVKNLGYSRGSAVQKRQMEDGLPGS